MIATATIDGGGGKVATVDSGVLASTGVARFVVAAENVINPPMGPPDCYQSQGSDRPVVEATVIAVLSWMVSAPKGSWVISSNRSAPSPLSLAPAV